MGAYSDSRIISPAVIQQLTDTVLHPALDAMARRGTPFQGFLYAGIMLTAKGPRVLEFNARLGDPETQPLMVRLESDLLEPLQAAAEGDLARVKLHWSTRPSVCVVLCAEGYPGQPAKGDEIAGIDAAQAAGTIVFQAGTAQRDGHLLTAGGRVLGVTASGPTLPEAIRIAYEGAARIQFRGMHFRRDIGAKGLVRW
jgi:phosphoribosylamine--glycine ligase